MGLLLCMWVSAFQKSGADSLPPPCSRLTQPAHTWSDCFYQVLGGSDGKESACSAGDPASVPGLGRSPEKGMATHSSILA